MLTSLWKHMWELIKENDRWVEPSEVEEEELVEA